VIVRRSSARMRRLGRSPGWPCCWLTVGGADTPWPSLPTLTPRLAGRQRLVMESASSQGGGLTHARAAWAGLGGSGPRATHPLGDPRPASRGWAVDAGLGWRRTPVRPANNGGPDDPHPSSARAAGRRGRPRAVLSGRWNRLRLLRHFPEEGPGPRIFKPGFSRRPRTPPYRKPPEGSGGFSGWGLARSWGGDRRGRTPTGSGPGSPKQRSGRGLDVSELVVAPPTGERHLAKRPSEPSKRSVSGKKPLYIPENVRFCGSRAHPPNGPPEVAGPPPGRGPHRNPFPRFPPPARGNPTCRQPRAGPGQAPLNSPRPGTPERPPRPPGRTARGPPNRAPPGGVDPVCLAARLGPPGGTPRRGPEAGPEGRK